MNIPLAAACRCRMIRRRISARRLKDGGYPSACTPPIRSIWPIPTRKSARRAFAISWTRRARLWRWEYEFQKKKTGFVVCFYRSEEKADKKPIEADKKPIKAERQEKIIEYVKEHGTISNKEARELLGLADSTTKRLLKEMVEENILTVEGERKARKYLLKK